MFNRPNRNDVDDGVQDIQNDVNQLADSLESVLKSWGSDCLLYTSHCRRGIRRAGKTYCPRHQLGYLAYFYLLFMLYFCRRGINTVEYAGAESRWILSLGTGIAQYSPCEINHGLRDITFRNQLPELGAVYRFQNALLLKPSR